VRQKAQKITVGILTRIWGGGLEFEFWQG